MRYNSKAYLNARKKGYRSNLETIIAKQITKAKHVLRYETIKIKWIDFAVRSYTPDFVLDNGLIIEVKGFFSTADRRKHLEIKKQHPDLDVRLVFENSNRKLRKGSVTSYATWCQKHDILYCDRVIPQDWLQEKLISMPPKLIKANPESEDYLCLSLNI